MMAQYLAIKQAHPPDCLLFYRMGDFYEMFFDDAIKAAATLDIALTKRGKHQGEDIPMCGVPVRSHEMYLSRLVKSGFKVALCEQTEDPAEAKKRGAKSVVSREVVRLATAGTLTEDALLDARANNYLLAIAEAQGGLGLAWVDVSTGAFSMQAVEQGQVGSALARLSPSEILVSERLLQEPDLFEVWADFKTALTPLPPSRFGSENGARRLKALFDVGTLDGFGAFNRAEISAGGALVDYIELTQKGRLPRLDPPQQVTQAETMGIDPATRRNLELTMTLSGERKGSLLSAIDRTVTGAGARVLTGWLSAPLTQPAKIAARHDAVAFLVEETQIRTDLREALKRCPDMERALSRLGLERGGPRDLAAIRDAVKDIPQLRNLLLGLRVVDLETSRGTVPPPPPTALAEAAQDLGEHSSLLHHLERALAAELPLNARDGGFIQEGYQPGLDEIKQLRKDGFGVLSRLERRYAEQTGIATLKIRHNNIIGHHIEIPAKQMEKVGPEFVHRQSMATSARYTTMELIELSSRIQGAAEQATALELKCFNTLVDQVLAQAPEIARAARALARLDVFCGLAEIAAERHWTRPHVDDSLTFDIQGGRHPVVEAALEASHAGSFIANDSDLGPAQRLWLITGPNMAGKSTFLRQNAVIAVLAQMGSFVPAARANLGVVDRLFSRVGAADDLARGRSTFMVEMVETAAILNQATKQSLVILDEIGRGTATFDGLSIAWAVVENLHEVNQCRGLFATHYHELTRLTARLPRLSCRRMRVKEWQGDVVFLHEVTTGAAERSYGIHVARLAGLPPGVLRRAEEVLSTLERGESSNALSRMADDLPLFSARPVVMKAAPAALSAVEERLKTLSLDDLTPRQALDLLYALKNLTEKKLTDGEKPATC